MINELWKASASKGWIQLFRYFLVGGIAFTVDFGLLWVLTEWGGLHYLLSASLSFAAGLSVNYVLSVLWVFKEHLLHSRMAEFILFVLIGLAGLGLNEALLWCLTRLLNIHYMASKIVSSVVVFFWNFTARKFLLFHEKSRK